ncbi:MAG: cobalamin-dependent protein [Anaerolineae bacterium]|nr:cobalamin-dependent protein [Anaerolineae bacterium]
MSPSTYLSPRERVKTALRHETPDRTPVDFLATLEIWERLVEKIQPDVEAVGPSDLFDPRYEAILRHFDVDCRVISYDQFYNPPESALHPGAKVEWWDVLSRSTPSRMWRQMLPDGSARDIWGHHIRIVHNPTGAYEEYAQWPLAGAQSINDLKTHPWPDPDWWDFNPMLDLIKQLDAHQEYHLRFRIGSVFEIAWQLRGMQEFLMDLALNPDIPLYIMDRLTDIYVENTRRVLELAGDRLDMVYFYDDVATQNSLMISRQMWEEYIRPRHQRIIDVAKSFGATVMYHCDGALAPLLPELIDMGIDLLNPVQADAKGMEPELLKREFGDRLSFHGGIDIIKTLPRGTVDDVKAEVTERIQVLGQNGGYIMASSHHIQSDTPLDNIFAMYDLALRNPAGAMSDEQPSTGSASTVAAVAAPAQTEAPSAAAVDEAASSDVQDLLDEVYEAVLDGQQGPTKTAVQALLDLSVSPDVILYDGMIPAMQEVGRQFEEGTSFVPEMLVAAHAMQGGMNLLKPLLAENNVEPVAKVVIGTVQSDIHDIGKNLVTMMFEGAGFEVTDLGVNVPPEKFIEAARNGAQLIGMSALLTTTMTNIPVTIQAMAEAGVRNNVKIIVGGAPITPEFATAAGADGFAADANQAVAVAKSLLGLE